MGAVRSIELRTRSRMQVPCVCSGRRRTGSTSSLLQAVPGPPHRSQPPEAGVLHRLSPPLPACRRPTPWRAPSRRLQAVKARCARTVRGQELHAVYKPDAYSPRACVSSSMDRVVVPVPGPQFWRPLRRRAWQPATRQGLCPRSLADACLRRRSTVTFHRAGPQPSQPNTGVAPEEP